MIRLAPFVIACLIIADGSAQAADPLDYLPKATRVAIVVDNPRKLAEAITGLEAFQQAQSLPQVRELYDSTTARRLYKLLAYAEKELGAQWPDLLDQIAGNGVALGLQFGPNLSPTVAVACGTDSRQVAKAFELAVWTINEELARIGAREDVKIEQNDGISHAHFGTGLHLARIDSTILVADRADFLQEAIGLARNHSKRPASLHKARLDATRLLPKNPLAWVWLDFAAVKDSKEAKDFFDATRQDFIQTLAAGSTIDCLKRSDCVAVGLYREPSGFRLRVRLPAGREGLWSDLALHVPPSASMNTPGSLPLLEPPGTIYSQSFYLDAGYMWKHRDRLITGDNLKQFEKAEKEASRFIPTDVKIGQLLEMWGAQHRIVVVNHEQRPYKTEPAAKLPAFGYVATMRDPKFGENLESVVRSAALIGTLQFGLKSIEVQHEGVTLLGYRFPDKKAADDPQGQRLNYEPCFAVVGEEVIFASTIELGKKLITELKKPRQAGQAAVWRAKGSAQGGADVLEGFADPIITEAMLGRGIGLTEARAEMARLVAWVGTLGTARIELDITATEYQLDVVWEPGKNARPPQKPLPR
jgi:hypothetical protein